MVVLYLSNITRLKIFNWLSLPRLCMFSRKLLERKILHVPAHGLSHFWQYYTGEHREYRSLTKSICRKVRILEMDAGNWAEEFLPQIIKPPPGDKYIVL